MPGSVSRQWNSDGGAVCENVTPQALKPLREIGKRCFIEEESPRAQCYAEGFLEDAVAGEASRGCGFEFLEGGAREMDLGVGKLFEITNVIKVKVGKDDVPNILDPAPDFLECRMGSSKGGDSWPQHLSISLQHARHVRPRKA